MHVCVCMCVCVQARFVLQTVSAAVELIDPSELAAMHVYFPESWKLTGWICRPPDCSSVNLGTWTEPLANTCDPAGRRLRGYRVVQQSWRLSTRGVEEFPGACGGVPFLQVMAGLGAPLVWQVNTAVFPSVTVWSDGGKVNLGATPATRREGERRGGASPLVIDCVSRWASLFNFPEFTGLNRILAVTVSGLWVWRTELMPYRCSLTELQISGLSEKAAGDGSYDQ